MANVDKNYPNLTWSQFAVCNDDATDAFEDMARRLFSLEFLGKGTVPHSNHNNPGVEVLPVLESPHSDGSKQRKISFQAKYFENRISYSKIKDSMNQTIKHYKDELDLVYLFCNKTLTMTTKGYTDVELLLKKSGIELYPISNAEVLDLVAKHEEIANYFFLPRIRPGDAQLDQKCTEAGIVINIGANAVCNYCSVKKNEQIVDSRLLHGIVQEKIQTCKALILELKFDKLREEIDKIFTYELAGVDGVNNLLFYKSILDIHEGRNSEVSINNLADYYKCEALWIQEYYKNPVPIGAYTFATHCIESQTIVLNKMFSSQMWNEIIMLSKEIVDDASSEIIDVVKKYYGLALFNLHKYDQALEILRDLYQKSRKENYFLYSVLAEIKSINFVWREGRYEYKERLVELIKQLDSLKDNEQYVGNKNLVAMLYLETGYNLGISDKKYLEDAIERYQKFSDDIRNDESVKYLYALCLELNGNIEDAGHIYAGMNWKNNANIACRYLICMLSRSKYAEAIKIYGEIDVSIINTKLKSLYLTALYYEDKGDYSEQLIEALSEVKDNFEGIIDIAFGVHEKTYLNDNVVPFLKSHINTEVGELVFQQKMELLSILSHAGDLELIIVVLRNVKDIATLNRYIVREIYDVVFDVSNKAFINHDKTLIKSEEIESVELIADIFLEANVSRKEFLQIKYICAGVKEKRFSMLKYAKELFAITNEKWLARDIIAMLFERNEADFNAYVPYIAVLSSSSEPDYCMAVAMAMLRMGKNEEADLYAYKALYYLNDVDNYEIYKKYFGYYNQNLNRYHDETEVRRVKNSCVVTLEENAPRNGQKAKIITFCLDSESEFIDLTNTSLHVRHIPAGSTLYLKIQGSSLNQILKIENVSYKIINIESRTDYAAGFIFRKISEHPDKFDGAVFVLSAEKPEDLIEKLKTMTDKTEQTEMILNYYHFKENETGLPIDSFTKGNYDRYIDALSMLLYTKDQAFYAGFPVYEDEENQRYIPSLSTLVLLSSMNMLNVLDEIKSDLILPESYMDFFAERYRKAKETSLVSPGKLVNVNNQLSLIQDSLSHVEIWERIIDFCIGCEKVNISDDDRIDFSIEDINGEQFIAVAHLHLIHLDAFVLAKKEHATLLCDDLFFRKIATYGKIRNINFVSLLLHYVDKDFVVPIIMELSKTNYLYISLMARTDEEEIQLKKNILDGKLKRKYYSNMLMAYNVAWENIVREIRGNDVECEEEE